MSPVSLLRKNFITLRKFCTELASRPSVCLLIAMSLVRSSLMSVFSTAYPVDCVSDLLSVQISSLTLGTLSCVAVISLINLPAFFNPKTYPFPLSKFVYGKENVWIGFLDRISSSAGATALLHAQGVFWLCIFLHTHFWPVLVQGKLFRRHQQG